MAQASSIVSSAQCHTHICKSLKTAVAVTRVLPVECIDNVQLQRGRKVMWMFGMFLSLRRAPTPIRDDKDHTQMRQPMCMGSAL